MLLLIPDGPALDPDVFFRFIGLISVAGTLGGITHFLTRKGR